MLISPNVTKKITVNNALVISPNEIGEWLNLSISAVKAQTNMLTDLILSVTDIVEAYTWLTLRKTTYISEYDLNSFQFTSFCNCGSALSIEKAPIFSVTDIQDIEYLDINDQYVTFAKGVEGESGLFENVTERLELRDWASVFFREPVPITDRINTYKIRITFISGFDCSDTTGLKRLPKLIELAIKKIVAFQYTNRGDCASDCTLDGFPVPCDAKGMLNQVSVARTVLGGSMQISPRYFGAC